MKQRKRPKDKPKKTVKAIGAPRDGYIEYRHMNYETGRERIGPPQRHPKKPTRRKTRGTLR